MNWSQLLVKMFIRSGYGSVVLDKLKQMDLLNASRDKKWCPLSLLGHEDIFNSCSLFACANISLSWVQWQWWFIFLSHIMFIFYLVHVMIFESTCPFAQNLVSIFALASRFLTTAYICNYITLYCKFNKLLNTRLANKIIHLGQVTKLRLSCYLVLLSINSKTR